MFKTHTEAPPLDLSIAGRLYALSASIRLLDVTSRNVALADDDLRHAVADIVEVLAEDLRALTRILLSVDGQ